MNSPPSQAGSAGVQRDLPSKPGRRKRAALALVLSSLVTLCGLEFAARWYSLGGGLSAIDSLLGTSLDASGTTVASFVPHPEFGYWRNPLHPKHNSLGLRGEEDMLGDRTHEGVRILVIGDSVAEPLKGFVAQIEASLQAQSNRPVEVINGAVPGYTTLQERLYLAHILPSLDVDLVLLQYCLNDNYDFLHLMTTRGSRLLTLEAKSYLFSDNEGLLASLTRSSYLVYGLRKTLYQRGQDKAPHPWLDRIFGTAWDPKTWTKQREHLQAMGGLLSDLQVPFALVVVPHESQLDQTRIKEFPVKTGYPQEQLRTICLDQGTPYLDLLPTFAASSINELYVDGIHLNEAGHQLTSSTILSFMQQNGLDFK